jgi:hypothetical protein
MRNMGKGAGGAVRGYGPWCVVCGLPVGVACQMLYSGSGLSNVVQWQQVKQLYVTLSLSGVCPCTVLCSLVCCVGSTMPARPLFAC